MKFAKRALLRAAVTGLAVALAAPAMAAEPAAASEWDSYLEALKPAGDKLIANIPDPGDPQDRQDAWRVLMATVAQGYQEVVYSDPDYPEFLPIFSTSLNLSAPNPDYAYRSALINGSGVYRMRGKRGTNRMTLVSMSPGTFALGTGGANTASHDLDELTLGADGSFSVIISKERPAGYTGDWWYLDPRTTQIGLRVASYDWGNEQESQVGIERLDVPSSAPRMSAVESDRRLKLLATWAEKSPMLGYGRINALAAKGMTNRLEVFDYSGIGGAQGQVYVEGLYDLQPSEGLLLEARVPDKCKYWSFLIGNEMFQTVDWMQHQSSLNGFQARVDADGVVRMVISPSDPGVPNWLDTGGNQRGIIQIRWNNCTSAPTPVATKVALSDLRAHIPAATPVVTAAERDTQLRNRRLGAQMRRIW